MDKYICLEAAKRKFFNSHEFVYYGTDVYNRLDEVQTVDVVSWAWLERFADELWAARPIIDFLKIAREAYSNNENLNK